MDIKKIKKLITLVETSDISSLCVEEDQLKIEIKKDNPNTIIQTSTIPQSTAPQPVQTKSESPQVESSANETHNFEEIKSPMVGTFYASPNPESDAFVSVGSHVEVGKIVCIVEAMKLFNEIESEVSGKIEKICVNNGDAVEFGQTLFLVSKS